MEIVFATRDLADMYEDNATAKDQSGYNQERACRLISIINMIRASTGIDDLRTRHCLKYETLSPEHGGLSTIHVDESHLLIVEDGSYKISRKLIVKALVNIKRRFKESISTLRQTQQS